MLVHGLLVESIDLRRLRGSAGGNDVLGSSTISSIRTVPPSSDSGLKLPCDGASSETPNEAVPMESWATTSSCSSVPPTR